MQYWGILAIVLVVFAVTMWRIKHAREQSVLKKTNVVVEPTLGVSSAESSHVSDGTVVRVERTSEITEKSTASDVSESKDVVILHVMAKEGKLFSGYELLQALLSSGMRFGKMNIFHRYRDSNTQDDILFSLASATEPGIFDMMHMGTFSCKGLTLFMRKTDEHAINNERYQLMLSTARHLSEDLQGLLLNSRREVVL